jgi:tRNA(fMet)-specific endonuclease VapC
MWISKASGTKLQGVKSTGPNEIPPGHQCAVRGSENGARQPRNGEEIVTASPVYHELEYGCQRLPISRKRDIIELYIKNVILQHMMILPYDERAAQWHAHERARLSAQGRTPAFVDGQIAAIAKVNGLILVTRNTSDFEKYASLEIQNWHTH